MGVDTTGGISVGVSVGACVAVGISAIVCVAIVTGVGDFVYTGYTSVAVTLGGSVMAGVAVGRGLYISPATHHANTNTNKIIRIIINSFRISPTDFACYLVQSNGAKPAKQAVHHG